MKKRVFSGSRPSGSLNIGNYLGAVKGYISLQNNPKYDCIYSVVDLHGITTPFDPKKYPEMVRGIILDYLGAGVDPKKCHLMVQSHVPEHVELSYLLGTIFPVSRLEDLPTYKDKKAQHPNYVNMGLLYYPVLMAADILLYKAGLVPVGKDQLPHIEITREFARKFNQMFGKIFPEPQALLMEGAYVPSLTGKGKMSKSVEGSYINLTDDLAAIREKLAAAPTDAGQGQELPQEGGVAALLTLVELFQGKSRRGQYERDYLGKGLRYQGLKEELAQAIYQELAPIQERRRYFEKNPKLIAEILEDGRKYCAQIARETLAEVKKSMGLV
ncbi:tryptophan--tRNA ligase [Candidatus Shapirobacteria bacterium CG09_land_8_20_14_0_10_47_13]|uniref:Tryptophan--tRNA ligase n=1 Tax=Candidatus Shapirobacteria bacterium CG09_land_8_20_14_0_10_47_13 TaxID=1974481 RepID=A0A2H0WPT6_9BACT|nr:MAG: tryptophan--tRNA ligase [Candidatus Shapirobacteria bacterium CG09_land_8_20_14_0_10_47_13]